MPPRSLSVASPAGCARGSSGLKSKPSSSEPVVYKGEKKSDAFLRFVQTEAGAWVGLPGQLKEFDELAKAFAKEKAGLDADIEASHDTACVP